MSKNEFLNQLEALLSDISKEEREEALTYYREYIEDAGLENEEAILNELGSVEALAKEIKKGFDNKEESSADNNCAFKAPEVRTQTSSQQNNSNRQQTRQQVVVQKRIIP